MLFLNNAWLNYLKVGDVVLVQDESVLENELNLVGLESLV